MVLAAYHAIDLKSLTCLGVLKMILTELINLHATLETNNDVICKYNYSYFYYKCLNHIWIQPNEPSLFKSNQLTVHLNKPCTVKNMANYCTYRVVSK